MQYIKIHSQDNVAVALTDIAAGSVVTIDNDSVTLGQDIVRGHKFALRAIAKGENVVKYGLPIGHALADIAPGEHVHAHNTRTNLSDLDAYRYQPDLVAQPPQPADREVQIYRRANGDVGVRNELWILPTVGCVNAMARQMQNRFLKETYGAEDIDGVHLFSHTYGCSQLGDDHINTRTMLQNMVRHPNAGAVLVVLALAATLLFTVFRRQVDTMEYPCRYNEYVEYYAGKYNIDPLILYSFIRTESNFNPNAQSNVGARGLMQITEETFDWIKLKIAPSEDLTFNDLYDPETNIRFGTYFVSYCLLRYHDDLATAAAAYHSGWGTVDNLLAQAEYSSDGETLDHYPYPQMRLYVRKITNSYQRYQDIYNEK
mgnify:CR=1 FL=1